MALFAEKISDAFEGSGQDILNAAVLIVAVLLHQRRPLHGDARWASAAEQRHAGLRSRRGVVLGRADGAFLIAAALAAALWAIGAVADGPSVPKA